MRVSSLTYRNAVGLLGVAVLAVVTLSQGWSVDWLELAFFVSMFVITEWMLIPVTRGSLSFAFAIALPMFILLGPVTTAWAHALGHLIGNGVIRRRPAPIALFNFSQLALSLIGAALIAERLGGSVAVFPDYRSVLPLVIFALTYLLLNNLFVHVYFYLAGHRVTLAAFWHEHLQWNIMNHLSSTALGLLLALTYIEWGYPGTLFVFIPLLTVAYMFSLHLNLEIASREIRVLYEFSRNLSGALEVERVFSLARTAVDNLVNHDSILLFLYDEPGELLRPTLADGTECGEIMDCGIPLGEGIVGDVGQSLQEEIIDDTHADRRGWPCPACGVVPRSLAVIPLVAEDTLVGVMMIGKVSAGAFQRKHLQPLAILGGQMAAAIQNAILYERTEQMAITDPLTGLSNHGHFYVRLAEEVRNARRHGGTVGLLYLDIDRFKDYNDTHGHLVGDQVLRELAHIMREEIRATDIPARYGGEEFAVILPNAGCDEADLVARRLEECVAEHRFPDSDGVRTLGVTISVGQAVFPLHAASETELIHVADLNMYRRKEGKKKCRHRQLQ